MNKKVNIVIILIIFIITLTIILKINNINTKNSTQEIKNNTIKETSSTTKNNENNSNNISQDIKLHKIEGKKTQYTFTYKDETYTAIYTKDNWHIIDSYKIKNKADIIKICQALIDIHPIHGRDMISYRTAEDLSVEWLQHNIVYELLPQNNSWKNDAKDVDLNPSDQGKNLKEMYESRTGKK